MKASVVAVGVVACMAVLGALVVGSIHRGDEKVSPAEQGTDEPRLADQGRVRIDEPDSSPRILRHLLNGDPVRVQRDGKTLFEVEPLGGSLSNENKATLTRLYDEFSAILGDELADLNGEADDQGQIPLEVFKRDAEIRRDLTRHQLIQRALLEDDYIVLPRGVRISPDLFNEAVVVTDHPVVHKGVDAEVVFVLHYADYPALAEARDAVASVREMIRSEDAYRFNKRPYEERKAAYLAAEAARLKLKNGPPAGAIDPTDRRALAKWQAKHRRQLLPRGMWVDSETYIAYPRSRSRK